MSDNNLTRIGIARIVNKEIGISRTESTYFVDLIVNEITNILSNISVKQTENLISQIITANRIFLVAIGRVNLSLQCFGKRLSHLGFKVELVGALTEKPATKKDLLIVASGSGESVIPLHISKKAKKIGCKILHITSAKKSSIRKIANYVVELKKNYLVIAIRYF